MPRLFDRAEASVRGRQWLGAGLMCFALLRLLYVLFWPKGDGNVTEFDAHGVESAWTLVGTMLGWNIRNSFRKKEYALGYLSF